MSKKLDRKHCNGCLNDFYNGGNPYGIAECWSRDGAKREKYRLVPISLVPPYNGLRLQLLPTCYSRSGYVKVKPEALDARGYWK